MDMLTYLLKCGLKYMADCSGGAISCDYVGILGACAVSMRWLDTFADARNERVAKYGQLTEGQRNHIIRLNECIKSNSIYSFSARSAELDPTLYEELAIMPPESSLAAIKEQYEKALAKYQHW